MTEYARNQCPARGVGLTHIVSTASANACVFCGAPVTHTPPNTAAPPAPAEKLWPSVFDHRYTPTATGLCLRCKQNGDAHAPMKGKVEDGDCPVDHRGLKPYSECVLCLQPVEPRLATGKPSGPESGRGRGALDQKSVERLVAGIKAGYWKP